MEDEFFWILFPTTVVVLFYFAASLAVWPYARPLLPLWILLFAILVPPLLPWLLLYLACAPRPVLVVVEQGRPTNAVPTGRLVSRGAVTRV